MIKDLVEYFVKTLVVRQDSVVVSESVQQDKSFIGISVAPEDRGRIIGKDGKTIRAIRQCVDSVFPRGQNVIIDLVNNKDINSVV
jgi:predicted RNA-binding protein YlqC (UPF0109 family)